MSQRNRREFLTDVGRSMLVASVGASLAVDMGLSPALAAESAGTLDFGGLEPLVALMQESPADKLLPQLVERLNSGTELKTLVAAGALANARTFGGEDYIGYHTFMALAPAYEMSRQLPAALKPLPVLKVLHRNATRIQAHGGRSKDILQTIIAHDDDLPTDRSAGETLQQLSRNRDVAAAERAFAADVRKEPGEAFNHLQFAMQDEVDVHRVVLCWRAWSTLDLTGMEFAHTLLRQSLRYCLDVENRMYERKYKTSAIRDQLPKLFDQYQLASKPLGTRVPDDAWVESFSLAIFSNSPAQAADAAAAALADGIAPTAIAEALSLAANRLLLHDPGRKEARPDKPVGSVHGDSYGVHASDSANAWRNIARVSSPRNTAASMIVGAYHTAGQSGPMNKEPYPTDEQLAAVTESDPQSQLKALDDAITSKDQFRACAVAARFAQTQTDAQPAFDLLLKYATSEDGALHAEKYYRTVNEEFALARPAFRWRHLAGLARVTASEYGKAAPGYTQAKELLKV
ncbi:MAG: hypothetical protein JSS27_01920 [Planctomycetes bacterium]|nr:hypothetical protein [Planctomycetota bacterium]